MPELAAVMLLLWEVVVMTVLVLPPIAVALLALSMSAPVLLCVFSSCAVAARSAGAMVKVAP
jgi:hypothetical protein